MWTWNATLINCSLPLETVSKSFRISDGDYVLEKRDTSQCQGARELPRLKRASLCANECLDSCFDICFRELKSARRGKVNDFRNASIWIKVKIRNFIDFLFAGSFHFFALRNSNRAEVEIYWSHKRNAENCFVAWRFKHKSGTKIAEKSQNIPIIGHSKCKFHLFLFFGCSWSRRAKFFHHYIRRCSDI